MGWISGWGEMPINTPSEMDVVPKSFCSSKLLKISGTPKQRLQLLSTACEISNQLISPKSLTESQSHQQEREEGENICHVFICHRVEIECQTEAWFSRPCCRNVKWYKSAIALQITVLEVLYSQNYLWVLLKKERLNQRQVLIRRTRCLKI